MTNPAVPAQPVKPAQPNTGGYTGPQQRAPQAVPIPGSAPAGGPPPSPPSAQAPSLGSPQPAAASGLGITPKEYEGIIDQFEESPDQKTFQAQFQTLAEQKALLGGPKEIDERGYHHPDENFSDYLREFVKKGIAYLSAPEMVGGKGMTLAQARMMAIAEARKRWPQYHPSLFASYATPSGILPKSPSIDPDKGGPAPEMEFGPTRAAKLDHAKTAKMLNTKEFSEGIKWAEEYKAQAGASANAEGFAKTVIEKRVSKNMTGLKQFQEGLKAAEIAQKEAELSGDENAIKAAKAAVLQMKKQALEIPSAEDIEAEAYSYFEKNIEPLSVAAAFSQLY